MRKIQNIHFVGIGGAGMSGIAEVLLGRGYRITGSDLQRSLVVERLESLGAHVFMGHEARQIEGADVLVQSTAISEANVEIQAARAQHIPVVRRAEMLAELMRFQKGIAIAGTHGKTTTTSILASCLIEGALDPTFVIGGVLNSAKSSAYLGAGDYFVAEADESDASFLHLHPEIAVVTNIDVDHMATYDNDFETLKQTFLTFLHHLPFYGLAVMCVDDPCVKALLPKISRPILTYGFSDNAQVRLMNLSQTGLQTRFDVCFPNGTQSTFEWTFPGRHNALNAAAALAVSYELGVPVEKMQAALRSFSGIGRRFWHVGQYTTEQGAFEWVDDYAHHPEELAAVLDTARAVWPDRRICAVFQPHRYTRTKDLKEDFARVLNQADQLFLLPVYAASESSLAGGQTEDIMALLQKDAVYCEKSALKSHLDRTLQTGDVLLTLGAGDIGAWALAHSAGEQAFEKVTL